MGCISSKDKSENSPKQRVLRKGSVDRRVAHVSSSRRSDVVRFKDIRDEGDVNLVLIDKKKYSSNRFQGDQVDKRRINQIERKKVENDDVAGISHTQIDIKKIDDCDILNFNHPSWGRVPKSVEAEQVAAGWPSWLAAAAGEAIKGWVPRRANTFEKLDKIGQGTYSNVYKARDITNDKIVALKKVRFEKSDLESVKFMAREILILRRLDHPNIIKLEGLITSQTSSSLYLVFEYMEHDLTGLAALPGIKFTEPQIKCYMKQLLTGLDHCHSHGVLHRDIKGSNLLIDDNGILKIADFGLATFYDPCGSAQLTSRVVTLWYRAPELLLGATCYEVAVDLWSTGCILGELYASKPILPGRTEVEQLHKIFKLCGSPSEDYWIKSKLPHSAVIKPQRPYRRCVAEAFRDFPAPVVRLMETLLSMDPADRGTAALALESEFFTTKPFACEPSCLPKYPPSKEIDAKMREEEARRQGVGGRGAGKNLTVNDPLPNGNAESGILQKKRNCNANSRGEKFSSHKEKTVSGFLVDPSKQTQVEKERNRESLEDQPRRVSHSGPLVNRSAWTKSRRDFNNPRVESAKKDLSSISSSVATKTSSHEDEQENYETFQPEVENQPSRSQGSSNELESLTKQNKDCEMQKVAETSQARYGSREPRVYGRVPSGNKIYVSGPLLVPSTNMEHIIKEHDRKIQEFARHRINKSRAGKKDS